MKIFIVEDDPFYANLIEYTLELNPDNKVYKFAKAKDALEKMHLRPDVATVDYSLPDMSGEDLLKKIKKQNPNIDVVIISSQKDINTAISLLKEGAYDYIVKDNDAKDRIWNTFRNLNSNNELKQEVEELREQIAETFDFSKTIIGESTSIKKMMKLLSKASKSSINVTISGETGTGKEVIANAIHYNSDRKTKKFVAINTAAIPKELIESELFGHEKGAFTGAANVRVGKFEEADGGTIFLDEIGELDLNLQAKLLRVLQEGEVVRVGGSKAIKFNARVITATHKKLDQEVEKGNFRQDLYFRLLGLPIELPPLRDRENDILILAKYFLDQFNKINKTPTVLSKGAKNKLMSYHFPGNVRELKSIIELAAVMADEEVITEEDISFNSSKSMGDLLIKEETLKEYTKKIIQHYLNKYHGNVMKVAEKLDIGKSTIYQMIKNEELITK